MKRRSFLAALSAAPFIPVAAKGMPPADEARARAVADANQAGELPFIFEGGHPKMALTDVGVIMDGTIRFGSTVIDADGIRIGC